MVFNNVDLKLMQRALQLARLGMFSTCPNPRVGCVITNQSGQILGEGFTQPVGFAHAEVQAVQDARSKGHDLNGAIVYVTLEPCSHYGRTPPCASLLIQTGVSKVIAAMTDPNPLVAGKGFDMLRQAGIEVQTGLLENEAWELNIGFISRMQRGWPWVRMKIAASLDAVTALQNGQSKWITSEEARVDGHAWRARSCAILTGIGTVKQDDPQMTVRAVSTTRQPLRVIVDSQLEIDPNARILDGNKVLIISAKAHPEREKRLRSAGAEIIQLPNPEGKVDLPALMLELGKREINELHVEAGAKLNGSLIRECCIDELLLYMAPCLLGPGAPMFALPSLAQLEMRSQLLFQGCERIGKDLRILARFNHS